MRDVQINVYHNSFPIYHEHTNLQSFWHGFTWAAKIILRIKQNMTKQNLIFYILEALDHQSFEVLYLRSDVVPVELIQINAKEWVSWLN